MSGVAAAPAPPTRVVEIDTPHGLGRLHVSSARAARLVLALGHGAGGGIDSSDLLALATHLPTWGISVLRFEQPWRVAGRKVAAPPAQLDRAWLTAMAAWSAGEHPASAAPLVVGGRSAGARVACRTAGELGAVGVVALAFPLHPPGRPGVSRRDELQQALARVPVLVVQGERDPFGGPAEVIAAGGRTDRPASGSRRSARPGLTVHAVAGADHSLRVGKAAAAQQGLLPSEVPERVCDVVRRWCLALL